VVYSGVFEELIHHHVLYGGSRSEEPEYRLLNAVLRDLGSPLPAVALPGASSEDRQTAYETIERAYATTLWQLATCLQPARGGSAIASGGFSEGIWAVDLSAPPSSVPRETPGMLGTPGPSAWVLAGLVAGDDGGTKPPARDTRGLLYTSEESAIALLSAGERVMLLDAFVTGGAEGNHVMLWGSGGTVGSREKAEGLDRMYAEAVRLGLVAVRASGTVAAWRERIPPGSVRETLTQLGQLARRATLET